MDRQRFLGAHLTWIQTHITSIELKLHFAIKQKSFNQCHHVDMLTLFTLDFYTFDSFKRVNNVIISTKNQTAEIDSSQLCSIFGILSVQLPQVARYRLVATSCCWNQSVNHQGNQRKVVLTLPISLSFNPSRVDDSLYPKLLYQLSNNCHVNLPLLSSNARCQWARQYSPLLGNQCGGICGQLPESILDSDRCTISFKPTYFGTYQFAIVIQPRSTYPSPSPSPNQTHLNHSSSFINDGLTNFPLQATIIVPNRPCLGDQIYISCLSDTVQVELNRSISSWSSLPQLSFLYLGDGLCYHPINATLVRIKISLNSCGNAVQFRTNSIIYSNTMTITTKIQDLSGLISRNQQHQLTFSCSYQRTAHITMALNSNTNYTAIDNGNRTMNHTELDQDLLIEPSITLFRQQSRRINYNMFVYTTGNYQQLRSNGTQPIYVRPDEEIYFEINSTIDPQLRLIAESCYSSHLSRKHLIISKRCIVDQSFRTIPSPPASIRFSLVAGNFVFNRSSPTFIHCYVHACHPLEFNLTRCQGCQNFQQPHHIVIGNVSQYFNKTVSNPSKNLMSTYIILFSSLLALVLLVVMLLPIVLRMRKTVRWTPVST